MCWLLPSLATTEKFPIRQLVNSCGGGNGAKLKLQSFAMSLLIAFQVDPADDNANYNDLVDVD